MPADAYAMIGVLNRDIYNREEWNWVFGLGDLKGRTGVFSFARYDPSFFDEAHGLDDKEVENIIQFRGIKVMGHELGHMFGLKHCTYYKGIMNGSNSSEEALRKPGFLCPIGLKKLYHTIGFDILERYKALSENGIISDHFDSTKEWYSDNVRYLEDLYVSQKGDDPVVPKYPKKGFTVVSKKPVAKAAKSSTKMTGIQRLITNKKK